MLILYGGFPDGSVGKEYTCNVEVTGAAGSIPGLGRYPGRGHGNPLQDCCPENPPEDDRGAWWASAHRVTKSWTRLKQLSTAHKKEGMKKV